MANQYVNNFEMAMQKLFGKSAEEVLNDFAVQDMTYNKAAKMVAFKVGTVRKYCHRYNIKLKP
jgi:DNA-directed RNA polymerase specialized sigma24 family protein